MPLTRYQIRNEFSLADPQLYGAADKDDPEALLEGVAMAGLVGVLRQLGDLAEFAAEIFHDLHEELMATAARSHGLIVRVQQLEAEFPSIETAFLSQTSHSSFFYNTGVDWHPNVHMDQNLVSHVDLPRFVMDSYEECRGPPRLFLLDKFDVAGAGSCLKRYTDPSFFKTESSLSVKPNAEVQREKKSRKSKKKRSHCRNGETPEVLSMSHVKLQQLFLEERVQNHISDPARRVKLERRLNGSPFDSEIGKSYMAAFLKIPTPDPDVVRQNYVTSSPLKMTASITGKTGNQMLDIKAISPDKNTQQMKTSTSSLSDPEAGHKPYIHEFTEDYEISPRFSSTQMDDVQLIVHEVDKQEIVAEGARKIGGYQSDDEVDNYADALTAMDSEMETDSEYRAKNEIQILNVDGRRMGSDATRELYDFQTHSTDSQSIGNYSTMDGGNISSRKGKSSSYSGSFDLSENSPSEGNDSAKTIPSAEHCEAEIVNSSSDRYSFNGNAPLTQAPTQIILDNAGNENVNTLCYKNEFGEPYSSSCLTELGTMLLPGDPGEHFVEASSFEPESEEIFSNHSNCKAGYINEEESSIQTSNYDDQPSQTRDAGFSELSSNSMNELNDQETHKSYASPHPLRVLQLAHDNESNKGLMNDMMHREYLEKQDALTSVASPDLSPITFASNGEEFAKPEIETCNPHLEPEGNASEEATSRCSPILDSLETAELVDMQLRKPENDHLLDPRVGFSRICEQKVDETSSSSADGEELSGLSSDNDLVQKKDSAVNFDSEIQGFPDSPNAISVCVDDGVKDTIHLQDKDVATSASDTNFEDNGGDATYLDPRPIKLLGECSSVFQSLHQNGMEFSKERHHESFVEQMVNELIVVSSELQFISSKTLPCDYADFDLLLRFSDSSTAACSKNNLHVDKDNVVTPSCHDPEDAEAKALQKMDFIEKDNDSQFLASHHPERTSTCQDQQVEWELWHDQVSVSVVEHTMDVSSSSMNHLAELSNAPNQKVELQNGNLDVKSCHLIGAQVPESKDSHQIDVIKDDENISATTHHVAELRIPVEENFEPHKDLFDLEFRYDQVSETTSTQHVNIIKNDEGSVSSPTHHYAELRVSLEQKDEDLRDISVEHRQRRDLNLESVQQINTCEKAEDDLFSFTHHKTELKPHIRNKVESQNKQFDEKSWHNINSVLEHAQQLEVTESSEIFRSSDAHCIAALTTMIDQTVELEDHFDEKSRFTTNGNTTPPLMRQGESSTPNSQERESDPSSESSALHLPSQPSLSLPQLLPQFGVSKPVEDLLGSKFPAFGFPLEVPSDEIPPLPPLPPLQWRLGKVRHNFPAQEKNLLGHELPSVPPLISTTEDKSKSGHPANDTEISYPSNPSTRCPSLEDHNSQDKNVNPADYGVHFADPVSRQVPDLVTVESRMKMPTPWSWLPMDHTDVSLDSNEGTFQQNVNPFSPPTTIEDTPPALPICYLTGEPIKPLNQSAPSTSSGLDANIQEEAIESKKSTIISLPVFQEYGNHPVLSTLEEQSNLTSSSSAPLAPSENGMANGNRQIKLPRPRNPLIDAVVAHDKSKLRKVTLLPQPEIEQKDEERDSLLEQIRAKSFNLKPAAVARPSIQGPKTNLRVAAILEKANAIRQAFAGTGSDEDNDGDEWSDS